MIYIYMIYIYDIYIYDIYIYLIITIPPASSVAVLSFEGFFVKKLAIEKVQIEMVPLLLLETEPVIDWVIL